MTWSRDAHASWRLGATLAAGQRRPIRPFIQVGDMKMTSVSDVYAAGDIVRGRGHTVTFAKSVGVMAGLALNRARASGGAS